MMPGGRAAQPLAEHKVPIRKQHGYATMARRSKCRVRANRSPNAPGKCYFSGREREEQPSLSETAGPLFNRRRSKRCPTCLGGAALAFLLTCHR